MGYVVRIVDGDTLIINFSDNPWNFSSRERVRLIGVDTPEIVHPQKSVEIFGYEASAFTKMFVEGKYVFLEFDRDLRDRYGRILAYVYTETSESLNAELIKQGFGKIYTKYNFKYKNKYIKYEKTAKENKLGLWGL